VTVAGNLDAGQTSCTVTVPVTASDTGSYPNGPSNFTSPDGSSSLDGLLAPNIATLNVASIALNKTATVTDASGNPIPAIMAAGDIVTYTFTVTNALPDAVTGVVVDDPTLSPAQIACGDVSGGGTTTCTAAYTVTAADITAGSITNAATASGTDTTTGQPVDAPQSTVTTPVDAPALTIVKKADTNQLTAGQIITYTYTVQNTGNVALSSIGINDSAATGFTGTGTLSTPTRAQTDLAVGASTTCTATYTVTAADVNAGTISNHATATGTVAGVTPASSGGPAEATVTSQPGSVTIPAATVAGITQVPALDGRALALLALLIGGLAWLTRRGMRR
jgi:uncharacterized repeat protein (TIGR01451 family)